MYCKFNNNRNINSLVEKLRKRLHFELKVIILIKCKFNLIIRFLKII